MESKTILFTVDGYSISPRTEQKAGVQGSHNITEVRFEGDLVLGGAGTDPKNNKVRIQFIDGAGGFFSSGFLTVVLDEGDEHFSVTCPIPNNVTNSGGLAYVYLVVTKITYEGEKALEEQVYISPPGKLCFTHSGVGSPSEYAYKVGITNALVNAEIFVGQAENFASKAKEFKDGAEGFASQAEKAKNEAEGFATDAKIAAEEAKKHKEDVQTDLTNYVTKEDADNTYATKKELDNINVNEVTGDFTVTSEDSGASVKIFDGIVKGNQGGGSYEILPDYIKLNGFLGDFKLSTEGVEGTNTAKASWQKWLDIQSMIDASIGLALEGDY